MYTHTKRCSKLIAITKARKNGNVLQLTGPLQHPQYGVTVHSLSRSDFSHAASRGVRGQAEFQQVPDPTTTNVL